jgi:hypothetical protein
MTAAVTRAVHLPVISNSELRTFRRCAREHHYAYRMLRRPKQTAEALRFGTLLHLGLEAWFTAAMMQAPPGERLAFAVERIAQEKSDPFERERAVAMLIGYTARWGEESMEVLAVEKQFVAPMVNPVTGAESRTYRLGGKLDVVVRLRDGRTAVMDHKTASEEIRAGAEFWRRVTALDTQASMYHVGARALGYDVQTFVFDVLRKPGQKPLKRTAEVKYKKDGSPYANQRLQDETPEEYRERILAAMGEDPERYFARGEAVRLESEERDAALDVWQTSRLVREAELERRWPRNPDACVRYGKTCAYFDVCSGVARIEDDAVYRTATQAHEELAPEEIPA